MGSTGTPRTVPALRAWEAGPGACTPGAPVDQALDPALASAHGDEAFTLDIGADAVTLRAGGERGLARGRTALAQARRAGEVPVGSGTWWPDYPVRGLVLDVARRPVAPAYVRDVIRTLGWWGLNTLVLHVNDNEIVEVTGRGWDEAQHAFRLRSEAAPWSDLAAPQAYSRTDWASFEAVAARAGVTLIPEFDTPAHSRSIVVARPDLGLRDEAGATSDMLDLENPATTPFVLDLIDHFAPWFAGPAVHVGADEYVKTAEPAYRRHVEAMVEHVSAAGREPWVWGSVAGMGGDPADYARTPILCAWNDDWYGLRAALDDGFRVVNCHDEHLYVVPFADYYAGRGLPVRELYETWAPHVAGPDQSVEPGRPGLLGAMAALWNDSVLLDYDEETMLSMIGPALPMLGQKCAGAAPTWADHEAAVAAVGAPPDAETPWGRGG